MSTIDEKRVYSDKGGKTEAFVAAAIGVIVVEVSDDLIGGFGVERRCAARDVAAAGGEVVVATDEDVLVSAGDGFEGTGFGPAVAVGHGDGGVLAAGEDGRVARYEAAAGDGSDGEWTDLGTAGSVRAIDGGVVAAADGVHRVAGGELRHAGLDDVRDVAGRGVPLAATGEALYALGNGWMDALRGDFRAVSSDGGDRAHAVSASGVYARTDGEWSEIEPPVDEPIVDVDYSPDATVAVTDAGTFLLDAGDGWRSQALGLDGVGGLAVR
ncbi:HVO_0234 family beta-propeller protein [Halegenticoccus soli]|uniref:HVO_0234 family beta-propeller protein n=1 Tax=Halegenticoccus soli TaxID=1985678 RepID=UPI000C6CA717|nr:hypothetical protein [Halegenticoccus soli]